MRFCALLATLAHLAPDRRRSRHRGSGRSGMWRRGLLLAIGCADTARMSGAWPRSSVWRRHGQSIRHAQSQCRRKPSDIHQCKVPVDPERGSRRLSVWRGRADTGAPLADRPYRQRPRLHRRGWRVQSSASGLPANSPATAGSESGLSVPAAGLMAMGLMAMGQIAAVELAGRADADRMGLAKSSGLTVCSLSAGWCAISTAVSLGGRSGSPDVEPPL